MQKRPLSKLPQSAPQKQLESNSTNMAAELRALGAQGYAARHRGRHLRLLRLPPMSPGLVTSRGPLLVLGDKLKGERQAVSGSYWFPVTVACRHRATASV